VEGFQVQSFVVRETSNDWKYGSTLAAQETFAPILQQRMQEVSYLGKHAMVHQNVDNLKSIMARHNIEMILERGERVDKLERDATRPVARHGVHFQEKRQKSETTNVVAKCQTWICIRDGHYRGGGRRGGAAHFRRPLDDEGGIQSKQKNERRPYFHPNRIEFNISSL
jgi:hypothetical protein